MAFLLRWFDFVTLWTGADALKHCTTGEEQEQVHKIHKSLITTKATKLLLTRLAPHGVELFVMQITCWCLCLRIGDKSL